MLRVGTSLAALKRERERQTANMAKRAANGKPPPTAQTEQETLSVDVSGTITPIFVLGVDNPDVAPGKDYYIP